MNRKKKVGGTEIAFRPQTIIEARYDLDRRQRLTDYYNENFNAIRPREYTTRTHDSLK